ncbi:MAG: helix-turn-helix-type transcriptional regulator [Methylibium sp.]|nr:helix-turn-helix-type transcriptional regulator [Methylibium sp.]
MSKKSLPILTPTPRPAAVVEPTLHRSGAVARMLRMPVATLRVWERRYGVTQPLLSPSGQRLYSADDVRRLALLKQLTDLGHAIGSLAALPMAELQQVAATHAQALAGLQKGQSAQAAAAPAPARPWRLAVIGAALGVRLQRSALLRRLGRPLQLLGPFSDLAQAAAVLQASDVDALLLQEPTVLADWLPSVEAAAPVLAAVPKALLYSFATESVCEALATAGITLLREPQADAVLAQWLNTLPGASATAAAAAWPAQSGGAIPARRWDDAALADFAGLSSTIACECPRHVAELLMLLSHFEAYSAECQHRSAAEAQLHAYLRQVAAAARASFESALEHVALHEGLLLPAPARLASP